MMIAREEPILRNKRPKAEGPKHRAELGVKQEMEGGEQETARQAGKTEDMKGETVKGEKGGNGGRPSVARKRG